jgi:hypothetical protein
VSASRALQIGGFVATQGQTIGKTLDGLWASTLEQQRQITAVRNMLGMQSPAETKAPTANGSTTPQPARRRRRRRRAEATSWKADSNARRVPTFVMEATGLKTKKAIEAKYGAGATFEKGKPLPPVLAVPKAALKGGGRRAAAAAAPQQAAAGVH